MNPAAPAQPRRRAALPSRLFAWFLLAACLGLGPAAQAQVFELQGGSSTLYDAHGGTLQMFGENYTARASVGFFDHFRTGFSFLTQFRGNTVDLGDQNIPFSLPTDLFNHSYYFLGRGASVERKFGKDRLFVYGGVTSTGYFAPYLNVAATNSFAALAFYHHEFSPSLHFYSYNILSTRQTSIQSISWAPSKNLHLAASGGLGSNQPYGAVTAEYDRSWITVLAGYVQSGRAFQRIRVDNPLLAETDRENIRVELSPRRWLHLNYDRENYVSPDQKGLFPRASVNGYGGSVNAAGFVLHGELYDSRTEVGNSRAIAGGVRRNFFNWLDLSEDYFRSAEPRGATTHSLVTTVREKVSRRITLAQYVNAGNGQTSISYGGTFFSNRFSFGVDYQTVYLPLVAGGQSQFKQVLVANVRLLLPHSVEVNGMSDVSPTGKVRYTGYFSAYAYRGLGAAVPGAPAVGPGMYAYVVRGRVVDESAEPVRGAAVRVQGEIAFTNSEGEFLVRRKHAEDCSFDVALNEFMVAGRYEVVRAPKRVKATREEAATVQEVVVKRLRTMQKQAEASPETLPGGELGSPTEALDLPLGRRGLTLLQSYADRHLEAKLPYNQPGGRGNAGTPTISGRVSSGGQPGCGNAAPGAARLAIGGSQTGCATAADGWRVLDSSGPEAAPRPAPRSAPDAERDSECFGLAKQLGACERPHRKLRVPARGTSAGGSATHRVAEGGRPGSAAPAAQLPASANPNASVTAPAVRTAARAASSN
jgi:hypothetical protein